MTRLRTPPRRSLALEPLESRLLLSANDAQPDDAQRGGGLIDLPHSPEAPIVASPAAPSNGVLVLRIRAEQDEPDPDRELKVGALPAIVVGAVLTRLPAARLVQAETGREPDGRVFDVTVDYRGERFDVAVASDGRVLEVERLMTADELPMSIQSWIERHYPGAAVSEVVGREDGSFEVVFVAEQTAFEATLRLAASDVASIFPSAEAAQLELGVAGNSAAGRNTSEPSNGQAVADATLPAVALAVHVLPVAEAEANGEPQRQPESQAPSAATGHTSGVEPPQGEAAAAGVAIGPATRTEATETATPSTLHSVLLAAFSQSVSELWLPRWAADVEQCLPVNATALQRAFAEFLAEVDGLAEELFAHGGAWKLTPLVLVAGAELWWTAKALGDTRRVAKPTFAAGPESTWITA